jgi:4-aminobutyrate aminotransferase-like enzyme/Ser/Thr protein kinase RdoA (MazF antagonist)
LAEKKDVKDSVSSFLKSKYDISPEIRPLDGHVDKNYLLYINSVPEYVLKLSRDLTDKPILKAQNLIFDQLGSLARYDFPQIITGLDGKSIYLYTDGEGDQYLARLLKYLPGEFLAKTDHSDDLLIEFGEFLAEMDKMLINFQSPEIMARHYEWDLQYFLEYADYLAYINDPTKRKIIEHFLLQYRENIFPVQHHLRKSVIHNDANDWNILSTEKRIIGAIDFGDAVYSFTISEVVVGATYIALETETPLQKISTVLEGYHRVLPLQDLEIKCIYYLLAARLCMSACQSAYLKRQRPDDTYVSIHEKAVWKLLSDWIAISPDYAENKFREACSLPARSQKPKERYIQKRNTLFSKALSLSYEDPIIMERGSFQYMFDRNGNTYLDCVNNIMHVGHCHPRVVHTGQRQMAKLNTNTRYLYDALNEYAEGLLDKFPSSLNKVFFVNSGSAASDLAIRLARNYTNKKELIVMDHGYHGNTTTGIEISPYKFKGRGGRGAEPHIHTAFLPGSDYENNYSEADLYGRIDEFMTHPVSAFICEPIVGCGGQVMLSKEYLKTIYKKVRDKNGLCIADEVQTGFGRVGSNFWAYELYDVVPDIVVLGKPMGNGHPIGAVVTTSEIARAFENGMEFFSSFGGNPVSCEIGKAVLEVIEEESLQDNALEVGHQLMEGFKSMQGDHEWIHDVRGAGLFLGIELIKKSDTGSPATKEAIAIINSMKSKGILLSTDGPYNNVIKIKPPICFSRDNADQLLDEFEKTIRSV